MLAHFINVYSVYTLKALHAHVHVCTIEQHTILMSLALSRGSDWYLKPGPMVTPTNLHTNTMYITLESRKAI